MSEDEFWDIIDLSRARVLQDGFLTLPLAEHPGDVFLDRQTEKLKQILRGMTPVEIIDFDEQFARQYFAAYRNDLWGAAFLVDGGCMDDGFMDFRATLISLGRELYTRVLNDPDTIAEIVDRPDVPYLQGEGFQYVATQVYEEVTGRDMNEDHRLTISHPKDSVGEDFDFHDPVEMTRRYPKMAARFPENLG